jgi:hypothetical protein
MNLLARGILAILAARQALTSENQGVHFGCKACFRPTNLT